MNFSRIFTSGFPCCYDISRDDALSRPLIFLVTTMPNINNKKRILDLYESGVHSANVLCQITNTPKSTVYDNFKKYRQCRINP